MRTYFGFLVVAMVFLMTAVWSWAGDGSAPMDDDCDQPVIERPEPDVR